MICNNNQPKDFAKPLNSYYKSKNAQLTSIRSSLSLLMVLFKILDFSKKKGNNNNEKEECYNILPQVETC